MTNRLLLAALGAGILFSTARAEAQVNFEMQPIPTPSQVGSIPLGTGRVGGAAPEAWLLDHGSRNIRNVSEASMTPVLPKPGRATGAAVVIAPGGGFTGLAVDTEGYAIARWFADHGVAAFVLKYRVRPTPEKEEDFKKELMATVSAIMAGKASITQYEPAVEDAGAAIKLVRQRSKEWGVDPHRVGLIGFSAGAMTTISLVKTAKPSEMPDFAASIYGPMGGIDAPPNAPPLFVAIASDDPLFAGQGYGLVEAWRASKRPYELHVYQKSGHAFGVGRSGTTTEGWLESLRLWIETNGFLGAVGK